jgi:hypothetical protein
MRKITAVLANGIAGPARTIGLLQASEFQVTSDTNGYSTPMIGLRHIPIKPNHA